MVNWSFFERAVAILFPENSTEKGDTFYWIWVTWCLNDICSFVSCAMYVSQKRRNPHCNSSAYCNSMHSDQGCLKPVWPMSGSPHPQSEHLTCCCSQNLHTPKVSGVRRAALPWTLPPAPPPEWPPGKSWQWHHHSTTNSFKAPSHSVAGGTTSALLGEGGALWWG